MTDERFKTQEKKSKLSNVTLNKPVIHQQSLFLDGKEIPNTNHSEHTYIKSSSAYHTFCKTQISIFWSFFNTIESSQSIKPSKIYRDHSFIGDQALGYSHW